MTLPKLPHPLLDADNKVARKLVKEYVATTAEPGGVAFTGSLFDRWDGGGDREEVAHHFTDADINAVAMLSIEIPPRAVAELLVRQHNTLNALLREIPTDVSLHQADSALIGPGSAAADLWHALESIRGIGWVTANKLLARKRPHLLPVYDEVVKGVVGAPASFWEALRRSLTVDDAALTKKLRDIGDEANVPDLSPLRVFDIIAWRVGKEAADAPASR